MLEERLVIFIDICFEGNKAKLSREIKIPLTTINRLIEGKSIHVNTLYKFEKGGLNPGWLISGMGTMFAHNEEGRNLRNNPEIEKKLINLFKMKMSTEEVYSKLTASISNSLSEKDKLEKIKKLLDLLSNWYHKINEKSGYLLTNFFLINFKNKFEYILDTSMSPLDKKELELTDDDTRLLLAIIISFSINYLGADVSAILEKFPDSIIAYLSDETYDDDQYPNKPYEAPKEKTI